MKRAKAERGTPQERQAFALHIVGVPISEESSDRRAQQLDDTLGYIRGRLENALGGCDVSLGIVGAVSSGSAVAVVLLAWRKGGCYSCSFLPDTQLAAPCRIWTTNPRWRWWATTPLRSGHICTGPASGVGDPGARSKQQPHHAAAAGAPRPTAGAPPQADGQAATGAADAQNTQRPGAERDHS